MQHDGLAPVCVHFGFDCVTQSYPPTLKPSGMGKKDTRDF
jgi:hypothetical protein